METIRQQRGLMAKVARELGITRAAVTMWRRVPAERVAAVERVTGIPPHELRPDLFPAPVEAA
jgi:DNA-binding transcriptional regulator YdaS (Cro superfamily)